MKRFSFFSLYPGLAVIMALACLTLFSGTVRAAGKEKANANVMKRVFIEEDLTHPTFKTLTVGFCPGGYTGKEGMESDASRCSRARLMYPYYKKTPWMNQLIAQYIILPMFAERLNEKPIREGRDTLYKSKLERLVKKGGEYGSAEKPPIVEFTAKLAGYGESSISPSGLPRPELYGPYLQFSFEHELTRQYDAHPPGPSGGFIVVDTRTRRILTFDDLILPGQEKTLEDIQRATFRVWLVKERKLPNEAIKAHFTNPLYTFRLNRNWRIAEGGLIFRFGAYEVGPRPLGTPEIFVDKERLRSIIQPTILEQIPSREELTVGN
ncbi:MAG: RsiV family protein [Betaproteobacteria bacterium]|nr:RsiV family protein [Betaproteobacteria bacterium]